MAERLGHRETRSFACRASCAVAANQWAFLNIKPSEFVSNSFTIFLSSNPELISAAHFRIIRVQAGHDITDLDRFVDEHTDMLCHISVRASALAVVLITDHCLIRCGENVPTPPSTYYFSPRRRRLHSDSSNWRFAFIHLPRARVQPKQLVHCLDERRDFVRSEKKKRKKREEDKLYSISTRSRKHRQTNWGRSCTPFQHNWTEIHFLLVPFESNALIPSYFLPLPGTLVAHLNYWSACIL